MAANPQTALSGLARALIQKNRLSETDAIACIPSDGAPDGFLLAVIQRGLLSALDIAHFISETFGYPALDLATLNPEYLPKGAVDANLVRKYHVIPLAQRTNPNRLTLAVADPSAQRAFDEIRFQTGTQLDLVVAEIDKLIKLSETFGESSTTALENLITEDELGAAEAAISEGLEETSDVEDAPIVKFIQKILIDAINEGASDIHFEPYEKYYRIRVRTDGVLREVAQPPLALKEKIAARIKVISRLDISEKRVPQDGRMKLVLSKSKAIDFRVSSLPTLHGEKIVMRILDASSAMLGVDALGYEPDQKQILLDAVERPYGMILVTGPTGSGKTVSLYTCLNILNKAGVNISTAEDPAEINLPGINQVNVNEKAGLTFSVALRSFLRQDPDVIMVGEIRDLETAEISVKAAQTGHLVLSTLHTNDAPTTLERLKNMGVAPFNIASAVILITAQRLARRLCTCKKPVDIPLEVLLQSGYREDEIDGTWQPHGPGGCDRCKGSGYKGRVGIYQVMPVTEEIAHIIMTGGNSMDIAAQAEAEGVSDLRRSGLLKVRLGLTSLEEVLAVTNE
ncbi:type IV-A pilus assembly ATPase PilB [Betaproteobacteria bacterium]|nr:type IV-A pilus assembly ATPase PilB [Betaproteobacteria bacterium]GHU02835.1 type IV-A pilus assembly ATPase PilB [Betaproteobacteria bacterium]GHU08017.1 type IV-A pilus assembly ATPase PilB [Betaproteobacteria bacterium]GHU19220.1 type IV-A pilus assembly ATPase PilB [Betaproteobacteria bacterium]